jgi:hypothetical protein
MASLEQPKYSIIVKLPDGKKYEFEQTTDVEWDSYENLPGRCVFSIPYNDPKITAISDDAQFIQIFIYRDQVLVWQGFVAYIVDEKEKTTIYGLGLLECLKWYRVGYDTDYNDKKIGTEILSPIWDIIDAKTGAILGDVIKKGTFEDPYTVGTSTAKKVYKTVFDEDLFTLCQEMIYVSRADSPSGAWKQDTVMAISLSETAPTFSFSRDVGTDKSQVIFELDSEIVDFSQNKDFRFIKNDVKGMSVIEGPKVITSTQTDTTSRTTYYLREISNVFGNLTSQTELDEKSKDYLKEKKDSTKDWYLTFATGLKPFDGYVMGDYVKVRINRGRVNIDDYFRVVGMEVTLTNQGVELVKPILQRKRS